MRSETVFRHLDREAKVRKLAGGAELGSLGPLKGQQGGRAKREYITTRGGATLGRTAEGKRGNGSMGGRYG